MHLLQKTIWLALVAAGLGALANFANGFGMRIPLNDITAFGLSIPLSVAGTPKGVAAVTFALGSAFILGAVFVVRFPGLFTSEREETKIFR